MSRIFGWIKGEAAGGILLIIAAILAMLAANSSLQSSYADFLHSTLSVRLNDAVLSRSVHHWINDGLMVIFFLLVGMEIKRECMEGHLASRTQAVLPVVAAIGGVICPALIYLAINNADPATGHGWAIASATDIAFAIGLLALFGKRLPVSLKVFITAVAVIDDLVAILIIAFFYSGSLATQNLMLAGGAFAILIAMNRMRVRYLSCYLFVGLLMWLAVLQSGIHATIAGVLLGMAIPLRVTGRGGKSLLKQHEHDLKPLVTYIILPLFAFANAGISLEGMSFAIIAEPLPLGIILGLFIGKQLGIFTAAALLIRLGWARLPEQATWRQLYGVCIIGGIGFTMSLFIGMLAFDDSLLQLETRVGVMVGSILSGIVGYCFLRAVLPRHTRAS